MSRVICPNCQNVSHYWKNCEVCSASLPARLATQTSKKKLKSTLIQGAQMDGHLIRLHSYIEEQGLVKPAATGAKQDEVMVIAKVSDPKAFAKAIGKKNVKCQIPGATAAHPWIVTARVPIANLPLLRAHPVVLSLKASRLYRPCLERAMRAVGADENSLPRSLTTKGGEGVIIGIIDIGLDFCHRNFRHKEELQQTRILALWDQKATASKLGKSSSYGYGRVYEQADINLALRDPDPYTLLGYRPPADSNSGTGAHGTYIADVAAGNGNGSSQPGIAPEAEIVFVDVAVGEANSAGNVYAENVAILEAVEFIFNYASQLNRPCVVNISLGTNNGPHDGSSLVERGIDRLVQAAPNRAVVVAAGNSADRKIHVTGQLKEGEEVSLCWKIPMLDRTGNELEIWYPGSDEFSIWVRDPKGNLVNQAGTSLGTYITNADGKNLVTISHRSVDPNNGENTVNIFLEYGVEGGDWTVVLKGEKVMDGNFQAWIERDEMGQSSFADKNTTNLTTLTSLACGRHTIVVGAYNARETQTPALPTSSFGPTKDGRLKPDVSAPGYSLLAARSETGVLRHRQSGTSLSAAVVSGIVALLLSEAQKRGIDLHAEQIRNILTLTAQRSGKESWHPQYGYGRVQADAALAVLIALS